MSEIAKLLKRIEELDSGAGAGIDTSLDQANSAEGWRLVDAGDTVWFVCQGDVEKRYKSGVLRTDRGVTRVVSIQPVDDHSQNCSFCGAQLKPKEDMQAQSNQDNLQQLGMGDTAGGQQPPLGSPEGMW